MHQLYSSLNSLQIHSYDIRAVILKHSAIREIQTFPMRADQLGEPIGKELPREVCEKAQRTRVVCAVQDFLGHTKS